MRFLRNLLVTIVVLLVLLGVGVVATDGMLRDEVERRAAAQIQKPAGFAQKPTVTVEGFPLAYFVLIQEIPAVRVQGDSLTAQVGSNTTVRLSAVDVTLHQVRVQPRTVESDQVSGTAAVSYADLGAGLQVPLLVTSSHEGQHLHRAALPWPCGWILGHEGQGVAPTLEQRAAQRIRITQPGGEESLNVAAAAAICLHASAAGRPDEPPSGVRGPGIATPRG